MGGRNRRSKKGWLKRNSETRHESSRISFTVRDVGCEGHDQRWTDVRTGDQSYPLTIGKEKTAKG